MARVFLVLAAVASILLLASLATDFPTPEIHRQVSSISAVIALTLHAAVFLFLELTTSRCAALVSQHNFPDRMVAQATKNRLRPYPFLWLSVLLLAAILGVRLADGSSFSIPSGAHLAVASFAVAFNLGTFLVESISIASQERLLLEIRG